ncbi:LysR substrate-binding domain-containing protein [Burkholderia ubonensis]|uniref:LysR substrate-binding domain-containing protein n=1 Tax=Burkholderia ubonensis TaxID=101571 RepID=UPI001E6136BA|nr:LysR substrate-binding domain-containing protein [Burkholderia ubonensis]
MRPALVLNHECIRARLPSGSIMRWAFPKGGTPPEIGASARLILGTTDLAAKAAAAGAGVACVEQREAQQFLDNGTLVQVLAEWAPPFAGEALYYRRMRLPSAAFRAFIDYVKEWKRTRETTQGHQSK